MTLLLPWKQLALILLLVCEVICPRFSSSYIELGSYVKIFNFAIFGSTCLGALYEV